MLRLTRFRCQLESITITAYPGVSLAPPQMLYNANENKMRETMETCKIFLGDFEKKVEAWKPSLKGHVKTAFPSGPRSSADESNATGTLQDAHKHE